MEPMEHGEASHVSAHVQLGVREGGVVRIASKFETDEISGGKECIMDSSSMGGCRREGGRTKVMRDMIGERKSKNS